MINHIMIPYDNSESATHAFEYAIDLAEKYSSSISIITCISIQAPTDLYFGTAYIETARLLKENASKSTLALESQLKKLNMRYKIEILEVRSITDSLVSYAKSHNVDLILMGLRGLEGFKKLLLGSVASGVSQHSKCPVLIVK